jgi:hypothetical protein
MIATDDCATLRDLAHKCRCMARGASTRGVAETLSEMARDYEIKADKAAAILSPAAVGAPEKPAR